VTAAGAGAGEDEGAGMGVGEEPGFNGNDGCNVFCAGVVGTGCAITGGAGVGVAAVAGVVDSGMTSDIFTSFVSVSVFCWA